MKNNNSVQEDLRLSCDLPYRFSFKTQNDLSTLCTLEILQTLPHTNPDVLEILAQSKQMAFLTLEPDEKCSSSKSNFGPFGKGRGPNETLVFKSKSIHS